MKSGMKAIFAIMHRRSQICRKQYPQLICSANQKGKRETLVKTSEPHLSTVGGALRRYHRGHGFKSRKGLNSFFFFFRSYFHYCSCSVHYCEVRFHSRSGERWRTQSCGNCTENPTNQFKCIYCKPSLGSQSITSVGCQI